MTARTFRIYEVAALVKAGFIKAEPEVDKYFKFGVVTFIPTGKGDEIRRVYLGSARTIEAAAAQENGVPGEVKVDDFGIPYTELLTDRRYRFN